MQRERRGERDRVGAYLSLSSSCSRSFIPKIFDRLPPSSPSVAEVLSVELSSEKASIRAASAHFDAKYLGRKSKKQEAKGERKRESHSLLALSSAQDTEKAFS